MALARQSLPTVRLDRLKKPQHVGVAIAAAILAGLCGFAAFIFLVLRDSNHPKIMVHDQAAPKRKAAAVAAAASVPAALPKPVQPVSTPAAGVKANKTEFHLSKSGSLVPIGPIKLKLAGVNAARDTYDLNVVSAKRAYTYRKLKVDQSLWISAGRKSGSIELVVTGLQDSGVTGYWSESNRSAHVSSKSKSKRR
jgi:hypothetical protein